VWFALTRRATLSKETKRVLEHSGRIVHIYRRGSRVAACKGSFRTARLRTVKSKEDWSLWASTAALGLQPARGTLKRALEAVRLTEDGIVPLHLSDREALLGPAGTAYALSGIVVATDGSLKKSGVMGAAMVAKDNKIQSRSVAVFGPPSSIRPELTGILLAVEDCPLEEDLSILTDSLSAIQLLRGMQRRDFPLWLHRHTARHLLVQVVRRINQRAAAGSVTRLIKVRAHRAEPLNEMADTLAAAAAESDDSRPIALDLDPEAVHFLHKEKWVEWDARVREDLVQRAAVQCVTRVLRRKEQRAGAEANSLALPLTAAWLLQPDQGRETLGRVLERMQPSTQKKQILQSLANSFPCNALLFKWGIVPSAACALCGCPAETQSHVQCWCPALKEARIRAHHNLAQRLWRGIEDATKKWVFTVEATVEALRGLQQPAELIDSWQRACDEISDTDLEATDGPGDEDESLRRKRPDAWAVRWDARRLIILEYTRPNDRDAGALQAADELKFAKYTPLRERFSRLLPGWEVEIQTYTMGIRGSFSPDTWKANLTRFGLKGRKADRVLCEQVAHTLIELTDLYSVRHAALQQPPDPPSS
jgi:ribonuclease HI